MRSKYDLVRLTSVVVVLPWDKWWVRLVQNSILVTVSTKRAHNRRIENDMKRKGSFYKQNRF